MITVQDLEALRDRRGDAQHRTGSAAFERQSGELNIIGALIDVCNGRLTMDDLMAPWP